MHFEASQLRKNHEILIILSNSAQNISSSLSWQLIVVYLLVRHCKSCRSVTNGIIVRARSHKRKCHFSRNVSAKVRARAIGMCNSWVFRLVLSGKPENECRKYIWNGVHALSTAAGAGNAPGPEMKDVAGRENGEENDRGYTCVRCVPNEILTMRYGDFCKHSRRNLKADRAEPCQIEYLMALKIRVEKSRIYIPLARENLDAKNASHRGKASLSCWRRKCAISRWREVAKIQRMHHLACRARERSTLCRNSSGLYMDAISYICAVAVRPAFDPISFSQLDSAKLSGLLSSKRIAASRRTIVTSDPAECNS